MISFAVIDIPQQSYSWNQFWDQLVGSPLGKPSTSQESTSPYMPVLSGGLLGISRRWWNETGGFMADLWLIYGWFVWMKFHESSEISHFSDRYADLWWFIKFHEISKFHLDSVAVAEVAVSQPTLQVNVFIFWQSLTWFENRGTPKSSM